jgi:hypothetical protein
MVAAQIERDRGTIGARAVPGISGWLLFAGVYALGSQTLDRYIGVPDAKWRIPEQIASRLDGARSLAESRVSRGLAVDVAGLYTRLADAGLPARFVCTLLLVFIARARVILLARSLRRHSWDRE